MVNFKVNNLRFLSHESDLKERKGEVTRNLGVKFGY